jgi:hypothetical protein
MGKAALRVTATSLTSLIPVIGPVLAIALGLGSIATAITENVVEAQASKDALDKMSKMYLDMGEDMWVNYHKDQEQFFKDLNIDPNGELADAINNNIKVVQE